MKVEYLIREVDITSLELMTQSEYIGFTTDSNAIPLLILSQEESEEESQIQMQVEMDDWLIGSIGSRSHSGRSRGVPRWMRDENVVFNF